MTADHLLRQLISRHSRALAWHLPRAVKGEPRAVHQARVATRRLREAVPVLTAGVGGGRRRSTVRTLRRITRALGLVREMDVSLAALAEDRRAGGNEAAVDLVTSHLQRLRAARRDEMLARLAKINRPALAASLRQIGQLVADADADPAWRAALEARLTRRARALAEAVDAAGALYVPERLHAVRIAVKKLRYGLELAGEAQTRRTVDLVRRLKRAQDALGRLHDLQVLIEHVKAAQAESATFRTFPPGALEALARAFETECRALHGRYVAAAAGLARLAGEVTGRPTPETAAPSVVIRPVPIKMTLVADRRRRSRR